MKINKTDAKEMLIKDRLVDLHNKKLLNYVRQNLESSETYIINNNEFKELIELINSNLIPEKFFKITKKGDKIINGKSILSAIILADKEVEVEVEELN